MNKVNQSFFEPLILNKLAIPNRIVFGSHRTNFAVNNALTERHLAYYRERAKGGAGLIILEECIVHSSDFPYERAILAYREDVAASYAPVAAAIHDEGSKVFARLNHWGSQGTGLIHQREILGPSSILAAAELPKVMELEDVEKIVAGFGHTAALLQRAGIDGVEINVGQYSLLRQFVSPLTNCRNDDYGGSLENRDRLCRQVLAAIREETGSDFVVGVRLTVDEYAPWAGITPEMAGEIAVHLEATGLLDFFSISVGSIYSLHMTAPSMAVSPGFTLSHAQKLKEQVKLPVMVGGRIVAPKLAAEALAAGQADLMEMTRAQIADPYLVRKIVYNLSWQIKPCVGCNQGCRLEDFQNRELACMVNRQAGKEGEDSIKCNFSLSDGVESGGRKKVAVIGGGPAGMEAAIQAAQLGYETHLFERRQTIGGNLHLAGQVPTREGLLDLIPYYTRGLVEAGVKIHLNHEVTETSDFSCYQAIIVATGSRSQPLAFIPPPGIEVVNGEDVWRGTAVGQRVLLLDEEGFHQATGLIELLAAAGKEVIVATSELFVGFKLTETGELTMWKQRVKGMQVTFIPHHRFRGFNGEKVVLAEGYSGVKKLIPDINTIICCYSRLPQEEIYYHLKKIYPNVIRIGDSVAPRTILTAIHEGNKVGKTI